ncbi:MAG TPA: DUF3309 family protein [Rhizomicrobium sp.]|jgi:hypothetical protein|nr:DUF3309 family protein [Rhizomicrobium sp.]
MQRFVILVLAAALLAVLPVWPFDRQWTYGPAIAVSFLLGVNLMMLAADRIGRGRFWRTHNPR